MDALVTSELPRHGNLNMSDVLDVIETDLELAPSDVTMSGFGGGLPPNGHFSPAGHVPGGVSPGGQYAAPRYPLQPRQDDFDPIRHARRQASVVITEQPAAKALRFRYECEGRSAGSVPGANSTPEAKTFPSIRVVDYQGPAVVVVSCVTKDTPHRPHPHNLVGKDGCTKGVCTVNVNTETMSVTFQNLGIQCVKKKDVEESLVKRERIRVDPFQTGFEHRLQPTAIDLNSVRLCFQVFLEGHERGKFVVPLKPVVSEPIFDKKSMCDLVIYKMSDCAAAVDGGRDIILLCDKVAKDDVEVRFFEVRDGRLVWEGFGQFLPADVHKQVAICFRTPSYHTQDVDVPVRVQIELRRPSDKQASEPRPFTLTPVDNDGIEEKRRKMARNSDRLQRFLVENLGEHVGGRRPGGGMEATAGGSGARPKAHLGAQFLQQHIKPEPADVPADPPPEYATPLNIVSPTGMSGGGIVQQPPALGQPPPALGHPPPAYGQYMKQPYPLQGLGAGAGPAGPALYPADMNPQRPPRPANNIELDLNQLNSADLNMLSFPSEPDVNAQALQAHIVNGLSQSLGFLEPPGGLSSQAEGADQMDSLTRNTISELEYLNQLSKP